MDRIEQLRRGLKPDMTILEIGPNYNPIAPRAGGWRTTILDYADKTELLRHLATVNEADIAALSAQVEDVDIIWNGEPLDELCLARNPAGFDFLIASHVIEHIPDLIRFFQSVARLMKKDGVLSLAVPDLRYCFDFYKPPTSTAGVLAAYRCRRTIHFPETIFENCSCNAHVNDRGAWLREPFRVPEITLDLFNAYDDYLAYARAESAGTQSYRDAHCWHFTPAVFETVMFELSCLKLIEYDVDWLEENQGSEFVVQMRRTINTLGVEEVREKRKKLYRKAIGELTNRSPY